MKLLGLVVVLVVIGAFGAVMMLWVWRINAMNREVHELLRQHARRRGVHPATRDHVRLVEPIDLPLEEE